ncbi:MAG: dienelactone hydrolase family protein [Verrucomicrobiae bacterium]|nr:dienelactone hydrolase family protein [Verrucomicrobiae bacterium]
MHALLLAVAVTATNASWHDAARNRELPVKIYAPANAANAPLIVFSHGLGGSREGYRFLTAHWASNGYVCVMVQHPGSDESVWRGQKDKLGAMRRAANLGNATNRALDVRFTIDKMLHDPRVNPTAIGVAGHSFGAQTTLLVAGQRLAGKSFRDARLKAVIPMSSPRPLLGDVFRDVTVPCLHLTGTKDDSTIFNTTAKDRRFAFDHISAAEQWLVTLDGATHMTFAGIGGAKHLELIRQITTKFWDAHLKQDKAAQAWLSGDGLQKLVGSDGVVEQKKPER